MEGRDAFDVIAEPHRRRILELLRSRERAVGELVAELEMSQPAVSKHLRVLRQAGLVAASVQGPMRVYRVLPAPLREIDEWLAPYRVMWAQRLDALEGRLQEIQEPIEEGREM